MATVASFKHTLNKRFGFTQDELKSFGVASLALAFLFSFDQWGGAQFDLVTGLLHFAFAFVIASTVLFVHHASQRAYGLIHGVHTEFSLWWYGFIVGIAVAILTEGRLAFLAMTGTTFTTIKKLRMGRFRLFASHWDYAQVALAGSVGVLFYIGILRSIDVYFPGILPSFLSTLFDQLYLFGIFFIFWNLIPLPPLDGIKILYGSRLLYIFVVTFFLGYVLLVSLLDVYSFVYALLFGAICWFLFLHFVEP